MKLTAEKEEWSSQKTWKMSLWPQGPLHAGGSHRGSASGEFRGPSVLSAHLSRSNFTRLNGQVTDKAKFVLAALVFTGCFCSSRFQLHNVSLLKHESAHATSEAWLVAARKKDIQEGSTGGCLRSPKRRKVT